MVLAKPDRRLEYQGVGDWRDSVRSRLVAAEGIVPRYFFDISDGGLFKDETGLTFPDAHAARDTAIRTLPNIAQDHIGNGQSRSVTVLMRDENGRALFTASLTLSANWLVDDA